MPVSKSGKQYYTKEQYQRAKYEVSALEYAQSQGYDLVRQGSYYHMREHDSMIFTPRGSWFWNSRGVSGGAIEFCLYYEGKTLPEAVLALAGEQEPTRSDFKEISKTAKQPPKEQPPFQLPEPSGDFRRLFAYLCRTRGLSRDVVMEMLRQKVLYQGVQTKKNKTYHNAVFVYRDPDGKPVGAFLRGMGQVAFKQDVPGSDKRYGWLLRGTDPVWVAVFEAAIDAASQYCLSGIKTIDRLSLEGLSPEPLQNYLARNPSIRKVALMLDADYWGQQAASRLEKELTQQGYSVLIAPPGEGKDYNEWLLITGSREPACSVSPPPNPEELEFWHN